MRLLPLVLMPIAALLAGPAIVLASAPVARDAPVLVIAGWGGAAQAHVAAAGGRVIGPARAPFGLIAASADPGFADALRARGAWAVLDGGRIAALCGGNT